MEFADYKKEAIRFWELRRIIWNLLLIPPSLFGYVFAAGVAVAVDDSPQFGLPIVAVLFCFSAVGANICYSLAYVIEFWAAGRSCEEGYRVKGRRLLFGLGCFIGIGLALSGGRNIAILQYPV